MSAEKEYIKERWLYLRTARSTDGKAVNVFSPIVNGKVREEGEGLLAYEVGRRKKFIPGGVYEVETTPDHVTARTSTAAFIERWHDEAYVAQLQMAEKAQELTRDAAKRERIAADTIREALKPLRKAYARSAYRDRLAIEIQVLAYLRSDRGPEGL